MTIPEIMEKMIRYSAGDLHDIGHFVKVWAYAKTIGALEGLDPDVQFILEAAAITHDIACPMCREKYGNAGGRLQEREGPPLVRSFLADTCLTEEQIGRVAFLVGHHHTCTGVDGLDWQILLEADYIVNAAEQGYSTSDIRSFLITCAETPSGKKLIREIFGVRE